jgi:hypothetical protein
MVTASVTAAGALTLSGLITERREELTVETRQMGK